jgi:hypothetical protein
LRPELCLLRRSGACAPGARCSWKTSDKKMVLMK